MFYNDARNLSFCTISGLWSVLWGVNWESKTENIFYLCSSFIVLVKAVWRVDTNEHLTTECDSTWGVENSLGESVLEVVGQNNLNERGKWHECIEIQATALQRKTWKLSHSSSYPQAVLWNLFWIKIDVMAYWGMAIS